MTAQTPGASENIARDITQLETAVGVELAAIGASPILNRLAENFRIATIQDAKQTFVAVFEEMRQATASLPETEAACDRYVGAVLGLYSALLTRTSQG